MGLRGGGEVAEFTFEGPLSCGVGGVEKKHTRLLRQDEKYLTNTHAGKFTDDGTAVPNVHIRNRHQSDTDKRGTVDLNALALKLVELTHVSRDTRQKIGGFGGRGSEEQTK